MKQSENGQFKKELSENEQIVLYIEGELMRKEEKNGT